MTAFDVGPRPGDEIDDASLAQLIETDGRRRLGDGEPVTLARYLEAIPDLARRPDSLDAAIDMSLRWLSGTGCSEERSIERLVAVNPDLERPIREAAALGRAIWSTARLQASVVPRPVRDLPGEFGPPRETGDPRYELRRFLGEGAFGQVYLAVDRQLSDDEHRALVAIKVLDTRDHPDWSRQRLIDEAAKARRIDHPNVVRVHDRGVSDQDEDFIVYEYVDGGDLRRWIRDHGRPSVRAAVQMVAQLARGMHAAHTAGLVHCDLKPGNVMVTAEGKPKVADFGIAIRTTESERERETHADRPLGNLAFISPEQYRMEPGALTSPSDVYALGGVLFWLLTERLPNGDSVDAIEAAHAAEDGQREPPPIEPRPAGVDADLDAICRRARSPRAADRHASAAALADDLEGWLRWEPIRWRKPSTWHCLKLWVLRSPALAVSVAVALLLVAGGSVVLFRLAVLSGRQELEQTARRRLMAKMDTWTADLEEVKANRLNDELLTLIHLTEWLYGPVVLGGDGAPARFWRLRRETLRGLVDGARAAGRGDHLEARFWETTLGFFLLVDGQWEEAEPVLRESHRRWLEVLSPNDWWIRDIEAMLGCAVIARTTFGGLVEAHDPVPPEIVEAVATLEAAHARLDGPRPEAPVHREVLRMLILAYGPGLLDDAERRDLLEKRLQYLIETDPISRRTRPWDEE